MEKFTDEVAMLVAQTGPLNGQRWALQKTTLIGRDSTCDIVVPERQVSRHHARLNVTLDGISIEDLDSKNGTHYNGQLVLEETPLYDGDTIQIALAQKFVYLSSDATVPLQIEEMEVKDIPMQGELEPQVKGSKRLVLDKRSRRVWIRTGEGEDQPKKNEILPPLSVSQFRLLEVLYENQGRVVPRQELVTAVWGEKQAFDVSEQALDALVRRLRDRIGRIDPTHTYVVTVRGHGLRLDNPDI